jgi:Flp pilus assembly protein TadB
MVDPGYMSILLHDPRGHYVIAFGIIWQIIGMLTIRKIMDIKV